MIGLLLACGGPPEVEARVVEGGLEVVVDRPARRIEVATAEGLPVASRTLPAPSAVASVPVVPPAGATWTVRVEVAGGAVAVAEVEGPPLASSIELEAPAGQGRRPVADGDVVDVLALPGARAALVVTARRPAAHEVRIEDEHVRIELRAPGERRVVPVPLDRARRIAVDELTFELRPRPLDPALAKEQLRVTGVALPADPLGRADLTLPADRVVLPGPLSRRRVGHAPWTSEVVALANDADAPLDVLVRAEVLDGVGPAPAFRARHPGAEDRPYVAVITRVPARGEARAVLPLYVDAELASQGTFTRRISVTPLGADQPLHVLERPLHVTRGSRWGLPAFLLACGTSAGGFVLLVAGGRAFLRRSSTSDLVTIGLFGSLTFVVGAAFQLLGMGVAAVLGPFAPLLTGLPDDAFRAVLLGTLITLLPRPGVVAAATVTGFLMRGLALGSFHPADLLFLGTAVLLHEGALWVAGPSRGRGGWLRLTLGLGGANLASVLLGLATTAVLYRLYFAAWYVALLALLPGFVYVAVGCRLAVPIAESLRRVAP